MGVADGCLGEGREGGVADGLFVVVDRCSFVVPYSLFVDCCLLFVARCSAM